MLKKDNYIYLLISFFKFIPISDANIDAIHNPAHIKQVICKLNINFGKYLLIIATSPIINANINVSIPILIVWPITLIVETDADAVDVFLAGSELIIALVFGDENIPKPKP